MSFSPGPGGAPPGSSSIQEQRERWDRKRTRAACELVQTEQRYCEQLELVNTYFVEILKAKGTLRQEVRESIFSSIKSIHSVNQTLLVHLENGYLGRGFEQFCPQLHHYTTYVDNIHNARKVLGVHLKKNKAFRRFKKLQENRPEFHNCKLEDLLPLPLQRVQQYKHFLRDLTENTSPDNPEFQQLSSAVAAVSEVSQRIHDNARSHENHLQLRRVQKLLTGRRTRLLTPGRWYIREGWLRAVPPKGAEAKLRMFFLFSDVLLQAKRCSPLHPSNGDRFSVQRVFPLQDCAVDKVFGHTQSQGGLLSLSFPQAKLLLMSGDQEDFNDWYHSLSSAIGKLRSRNTVVHKRDDLTRRPLHSTPDNLHSAPDDQQSTPATHNTPGRKRNMGVAEPAQTPGVARPAPAEPQPEGSATKRRRLAETAPAPESAVEAAGYSCVIL